MARQSADAKLVVLQGGLARRPEPPKDLNAAQAAIWRETAGSEAVTFFNTAALQSMLADYCRHTVTAAEVSTQIDAFNIESLRDDENAKIFDRLTKIRDRETKAAADKATKLRLTNQSRYTPQAAATASKNQGPQARPWD